MNPRLRVEVGRQANFEYEITPTDEDGPVWLGRGAFCKVRIADTQLSRRHSEFTFQQGRFFVEDMGSKNGTRVNGELIDGKVALNDGDHVTVGSHELAVIFPAPAKRSATDELPELGTGEEEQEAYAKCAALVGQELAGYLIGKIVFNGDTSVIFRATEQESQAPLAVKVLKPLERVTIEDQNRFIRGAKHSAVLRHPNFVRVYKSGRIDDWFYVAMEFVAGRNLQDIVERQGGPLDVEAAVTIMRQVLGALQHAYESDLVLRAVRPDNVIVAEDLQVKLTDFDLVKPLGGRQDSQVTRVMDGSLSVDPSFAAPELIAYPAVADQKADVFGAGATLYYMLCAQAPFSDKMPATKLTSAFDRSARDPRAINEAVPEQLCDLLKQAMSDYERYNTPGDMLEALEQAATEAGI